ncbi:MAG: hypothetical protein AB7N90_07610 [Vicinamibacterales bacterium]
MTSVSAVALADSGDQVRAVARVLTLMTAAFILAKTGRDALYFQRDGILALPFAIGLTATLAMPTALGTLLVLRRFGRTRTRPVALGLTALGLGVAALVARPGGGPGMTVFFVLVPVVFGVLFSIVWLLVGERVGGDEAVRARTYASVGAASIAGGVGGAVLARVGAPFVGAYGLLGASAVLMALAAGLVYRLSRPPVAAPSDVPLAVAPPVARARFARAWQQPYVRLLTAMAAAGAMAGVLIEFTFYLAAASSGRNGTALATLFANLYLGLNVLAWAVQRTLGPRLQGRIGVAGALLVLPVVLVGLAPITALAAVAAAQGLIRLVEGGLKASVHRVSWEQAFLPITGGCRTEAKLLVEGVAVRLAELLAAVALGVWVTVHGVGEPQVGLRWLGGALAVVAAGWLLLTLRLRRSYGGEALGSPMGTVRVPDS